MFLLKIIIIAFVIGYVVWFVNKHIFGKNIVLAKAIVIALVVTSLIYLVLGILSYLVEGG